MFKISLMPLVTTLIYVIASGAKQSPTENGVFAIKGIKDCEKKYYLLAALCLGG